MNSKTLFVAIAIVTAFGMAAVVGLATVTPVLAQDNMTMGGNMTGGNMTMGGDNMTMGS
jgi:Flp pilus assembly protein CpaB